MRVLLCDFHSLIDTNHLCGRRRFSLKSLRETLYSPLLLVHLGSLWGSQVLEVFFRRSGTMLHGFEGKSIY